MSRSKWKGPYLKNLSFNLMSRNSTIVPSLLNSVVKVHNGKEIYDLEITEEMFGHKLGEFCNTRKKHYYKKKK